MDIGNNRTLVSKQAIIFRWEGGRYYTVDVLIDESHTAIDAIHKRQFSFGSSDILFAHAHD